MTIYDCLPRCSRRSRWSLWQDVSFRWFAYLAALALIMDDCSLIIWPVSPRPPRPAYGGSSTSAVSKAYLVLDSCLLGVAFSRNQKCLLKKQDATPLQCRNDKGTAARGTPYAFCRTSQGERGQLLTLDARDLARKEPVCGARATRFPVLSRSRSPHRIRVGPAGRPHLLFYPSIRPLAPASTFSEKINIYVDNQFAFSYDGL